MYGLVNRAIEGLACEIGGPALWDAIRKKAGVDDPTFLNLESYPDQVTFSLVDAASEVLQLSREEVLQRFGEYWIQFTATIGYGSLLDAGGNDFRTFLRNLDRMHEQVGLSLPELRPPSFVTRDLGDSEIQVDYFSDREGLSPMLVGLFNGLAKKFHVDTEIRLLRPEETTENAKASFRIRVKETVHA